MAVPNTLSYYNTATITAVKSFIVQAPSLCFNIIQMSQEIWFGLNMMDTDIDV